jgi:hypothetical protein
VGENERPQVEVRCDELESQFELEQRKEQKCEMSVRELNRSKMEQLDLHHPMIDHQNDPLSNKGGKRKRERREKEERERRRKEQEKKKDGVCPAERAGQR